MLSFSYDAEASDASSGDLMAAYPQARSELVALLTCRAYYVGQHYQDKGPAEVISARSSEACIKEREQFIKRIGNQSGGPQFLARLDRIIVAKVNKVRESGPPSGPGPDWSKCLANHVVVPASVAGVDNAMNTAFSACKKEEDAVAAFLSARLSPSEVPKALSTVRQGFTQGLRNSILQALDRSVH
jgi:hypothetical protein